MRGLHRRLTPAQRVGKTANLVIFLGILYGGLNLAAVLGAEGLARRGYGGWGVLLALAFLALGYAIRFGSQAALFGATGLFALLVAWTAGAVLTEASLRLAVRLGLTTLALVALLRSRPAMADLKRRGDRPDRSNKYLTFVLAPLGRTNRPPEERGGDVPVSPKGG
ncbi:MAG: hypothetical protein ACE5H5_04310 [Nitrospinota bacterium]